MELEKNTEVFFSAGAICGALLPKLVITRPFLKVWPHGGFFRDLSPPTHAETSALDLSEVDVKLCYPYFLREGPVALLLGKLSAPRTAPESCLAQVTLFQSHLWSGLQMQQTKTTLAILGRKGCYWKLDVYILEGPSSICLQKLQVAPTVPSSRR